MALAWILKVKALLERSGRPAAIENMDAMAASGLIVYRNLFANVHTANQQARKHRKQTEQWLLFVLDAQKRVRNRAGEIEELELAPFTQGDVRGWALHGELPESYAAFKESLVLEDDEG